MTQATMTVTGEVHKVEWKRSQKGKDYFSASMVFQMGRDGDPTWANVNFYGRSADAPVIEYIEKGTAIKVDVFPSVWVSNDGKGQLTLMALGWPTIIKFAGNGGGAGDSRGGSRQARDRDYDQGQGQGQSRGAGGGPRGRNDYDDDDDPIGDAMNQPRDQGQDRNQGRGRARDRSRNRGRGN